jgi:2-succinyl-5-enolpyruvyl-6-hydroxy-3-cyclohexene-1-carboxylate synthase
LAEVVSQVRFALDTSDGVVVCDAAERVLSRTPAPDLILQLGGTPVSSAWQRHSDVHAGVRRVVVTAHGWPDPDGHAEQILIGLPGAVVEALVERVGARSGQSAWLDAFARENATAWAEIDRALGDGTGWIARGVVDALPPGSVLALGNSWPIRDADRFCRAGARGLTVLTQRGAAGIDGLVSSAAGAAAATDRPTALLIGDVSLLHDLGGLWAARRVAAPLAIVVVDNGGGRIFDELPIASRLDDATLAHWRTPPEIDFSSAARTFDVPFAHAGSPPELAAALRSALGRSGPTLIQAP